MIPTNNPEAEIFCLDYPQATKEEHYRSLDQSSDQSIIRAIKRYKRKTNHGQAFLSFMMLM